MSPRNRGEVVVVGPVPPPIHGAARVTQRVVVNLRAAGVEPVVVDSSGSESGTGVGHHLARLRLHLHAAWLLLRRRPGAVYLAGAGGAGLWYQWGVVVAARLAGVRVVFHHHSYAYLTRPARVMQLITRTAGRRAEHVVLCAGMGEALQRIYRTVAQIRVCSNAGLFDEAVLDRPRPDAAGLTLGHLGNLVAEKGLPLVFATLRALRERGDTARLVLGGPVRTAEAQQMLDDAVAEFGADLEYLGPVPPHEVDDFYRRLDVFVFPSSYAHEAEPMVVLESARLGVPTVAFRVGCVGSLVPDPAALVDTSADFAAAALHAIDGWTTAGRDSVRGSVGAHFTTLRDAALRSHRDLITTLTDSAS